MTIIDTSAWIEFFRGTRDAIADDVDKLLEDGDAALCGPILTELRRGVRSISERGRLLLHLAGCQLLPSPPDLWNEAGELGFALGRRGVSVKTLDLLIAAYALAHRAPILTKDSDFGLMIKAGIPLRLA